MPYRHPSNREDRRRAAETAARAPRGLEPAATARIGRASHGAAAPGLVAALLLAAALALAAWPGAALAAPAAAATPPDFSSVTDILSGKRIVLPIDNLVISGAFFAAGDSACLTGVCVETPYFYLQTTAPDTLALAQTVLPQFARIGPWTPAAVATTTNVGRVFNLPNDVVVRLYMIQGISPPFGVFPAYRVDGLAGGVLAYATDAFPTPYGAGPQGLATPNTTVLADFNGDGFDDVATNVGNGTMRVGTANDVSQPSQGIVWGPALASQPFLAMAAGDFDGDGQPDIAGVYYDAGAQVGRLAIYRVDPETLAITLASSIAVPGVGPGIDGIGPNGAALAAGSFGNVPGSQLVLAFNAVNGGGVQVMSYSMDASLNITARGSYVPGISATIVTARAASLDALGGLTAQVLIGYGSVPEQLDSGVDGFQILTLDDQLNIKLQSNTTLDCTQCLEDVVIGNFTQGATPTLEVAVLAVPRTAGPNFEPLTYTLEGVIAQIYRLDPTTFAPSLASQFIVPFGAFPSMQFGQAFRLAAGDTLGQSLRLGPPMKVTLNSKVQPRVVLGMPPMHVDYAPPAGDPTGTPVELNVTAAPDGFFSSYSTAVTNGTQSSSSVTTSYSFGTLKSEGGGGANQIGVLGANLLSFAGSTRDATGSLYSNFVQNQYSTYATEAFDASTSTGFSDHVWYTAHRFNLWIYPVLGQVACPASSAANCDASEKLPLALIFSGPDQVEQANGDSTTLEWYQPVHEPGNVLSYPWSQSLLAPTQEGYSVLGSSEVWTTDTASQALFASWSSGGGSSVTSGSVTVNSRDKTSSAGASVLGFGGGETVDSWSSDAFSTVNATVTTVGASSGVGTNKPKFEGAANYHYAVQSFIFGQNNPTGTAQTIPLGSDVQVQATGVLQAAFIADPTGQLSSAGAWWQQTYTAPDVALNHPKRWTVKATSTGSGANCLPFNATTQNLDCLAFNEADPDDLLTSEFYWMRGLFVTQQSALGFGPQVTYANPGDKLLLQARVYNYSLADMSPDTTVYAQFYVQPYGKNATFSGPSEPIGPPAQLKAIPGFNSATAGPNPNWSMASTVFDTTAYADTSVIFWVVVWMQDGSGNMVPEPFLHGLTSLPAGPFTSIADVPIEPYSNNVGYYNQPIYIAPSSSAPSQGPAFRASTRPRGVELAEVVAEAPSLVGGKKTVISATLIGGTQEELGVHVRFFDGNPAEGGRQFDAELVPRLGPGATWVLRVPYRPKTCDGPRQIFVQARGRTLSTVKLPVSCP